MIKSLPGFREFYPDDCAKRNHIFKQWRMSSRKFGFQEYDGPVLEPLELFTAKSGDEIVSQLFSFEDRGERKVALRPEMTPTLARLVGAKANGLPKPIKWFNIGEHYRYERPQKGRLRAFYQLNCDILGEEGPSADAEAIGLLIDTLCGFGFGAKEFCIRLSDRDLWVSFMRAYKLDDKGVEQALAVIDKMEREEESALIEKLNPLFGGDASEFWSQVKGLTQIKSLEALKAYMESHDAGNLEEMQARLGDWEYLLGTLEAMGLSEFIKIDLTIVRGLAYYTGFVFEAFQLVGKGRSLAGGGRYDHLVKKLGGPELPAVGFAMGDVTLLDFLEQEGKLSNYIDKPDIYCVFGDEACRKVGLETVGELRAAGYRVEYGLKLNAFGKQLKAATILGARYALVFGEDEVAQKVVTVKALDERTQGRSRRERFWSIFVSRGREIRGVIALEPLEV